MRVGLEGLEAVCMGLTPGRNYSSPGRSSPAPGRCQTPWRAPTIQRDTEKEISTGPRERGRERDLERKRD